MEENEERVFPERLNDEIRAFKANRNTITFCSLLCCILDGLTENADVPVPGEMDWDTMVFRPEYLTDEDENETLVILSIPDGTKNPFLANVRLRAVMRAMLNNERCDGFVIDPDNDGGVLIYKELIVSALSAALAMLNDGGGRRDTRRMKLRRPADEEKFEEIKEKLLSLRDDPEDYFVIDLVDDEEMMFLQAVRSGDELHVELGFDMSDFEWDHPLILGHEMEPGEALELLRRILVEKTPVDEIDVVQNRFRNMGFGENKDET